jgi:hypothetical protein
LTSETAFQTSSIQSQLLNLSLEVKLFRSLIKNKIKKIKGDMNESQSDDERLEDRYCRMMMTIANNLGDSEAEITEERKFFREEWVYGRVLQCISTDFGTEPYCGFWPSHEMARCLLCENSKTIFSESKEFMHLVTFKIFH